MWRWFAGRPFLAWLLVTVAVVVPGYVRQEQTIREAQHAANDVAQIQAEREADRIIRSVEACTRAVEFRADNRAMWLYLVGQNPDNPQVPTFVAKLNELLPALECNAEHVPVPVPNP